MCSILQLSGRERRRRCCLTHAPPSDRQPALLQARLQRALGKGRGRLPGPLRRPAAASRYVVLGSTRQAERGRQSRHGSGGACLGFKQLRLEALHLAPLGSDSSLQTRHSRLKDLDLGLMLRCAFVLNLMLLPERTHQQPRGRVAFRHLGALRGAGRLGSGVPGGFQGSNESLRAPNRGVEAPDGLAVRAGGGRPIGFAGCSGLARALRWPPQLQRQRSPPARQRPARRLPGRPAPRSWREALGSRDMAGRLGADSRRGSRLAYAAGARGERKANSGSRRRPFNSQA